jgi:hypothetical protein
VGTTRNGLIAKLNGRTREAAMEGDRPSRSWSTGLGSGHADRSSTPSWPRLSPLTFEADARPWKAGRITSTTSEARQHVHVFGFVF